MFFKLHILKAPECTLRKGYFRIYVNNYYNKNIHIEWIFKPFHILNMNMMVLYPEKSYVFNFWLLFFEIYIAFNNIFKRHSSIKINNTTYDKSLSPNDNKTNQSKRIIGVSQLDWSLNLYLWHDGNNDISCNNKTNDKIFYKYIDLKNIILGSYDCGIIENNEFEREITLPEGKYKIKFKYSFWYLKYKRYFSKIFNKKRKSFLFYANEIKYPIKKLTNTDIETIIKNKWNFKDFENKMPSVYFELNENKSINDAVDLYKQYVLKMRKSPDWKPYDNIKYYRKEKMKRILCS